MRIAVDAMGGDNAPEAVVAGAVEAARRFGVHVTLVGDREVLADQLAQHNIAGLPVSVHHASQSVEMDESPTNAFRRKKDSSMRVALELAKAGEANAVVSAGNSGAFMAKAMMVLKRLPGVERPAIATLMPSMGGHSLILDVGANVDCQPLHLVQFAVMGEVYARYMMDIDAPRVGLLANGEEASKGTELTRAAHAMLSEMSMNYGGYVEGRDVFSGSTDVVVTDGFTGNILLKASEGIAKTITELLRHEIKAGFLRKIGYLLARGAFAALKKKVDYREVGGAPLLGINGVAIISHGSSDAVAIVSAIKIAADLADKHINVKMMQLLEESSDTHHWATKKEGKFWTAIKDKLIHHKRED
jgi:glycerol-3-phosphate acyltransferase PlsX